MPAALRVAGRYRFTVKLMALLVPAAVVTVTCTAPYLAFAGTLHLICVALQETYVVQVLLPNLTELVLIAVRAPKPVPVMVTVAPRSSRRRPWRSASSGSSSTSIRWPR